MSIFRHCMRGTTIAGALAFGLYAQSTAACNITAGQVVINEVLPAPSAGNEWVELYNTTASSLDLSSCYIDDVAGGGGAPSAIAAGTTIAAYGFYVMEKSSYFNNGGDDARLLAQDGSTILDSFTYGSTGYDVSWYRSTDGGAWAAQTTGTPTKGMSNGGTVACGTGSWQPGNLEIHHINIGQGDATLIVGPTGRTMLIDVGESYWNSHLDADKEGAYIQTVLGCKQLDYVLITHFHNDHIGYVGYGGLWHLVEQQGFTAGMMLHRDYNTYLGTTSGTFDNWKAYLEGEGMAKLNPTLAMEGTGQVDLGAGVSFRIVAVDGNHSMLAGNFSTDTTPPSENDYSIGAVLRYGRFDYWIGGDFSGEFAISDFGYAYHDIEQTVSDEVGDVDVYRVNHHGSDHSNNAAFLAQLDPEVAIISVGDDNTYGHPRQSVVDRLLATADLYLTEKGDPTVNTTGAVIGGDIVIKTVDGIDYTVNGNTYIASDPIHLDSDSDGYYVGVDPDDANFNIIPAEAGGCDLSYQKCLLPPTGLSANAGESSVTITWDTTPVVDLYKIYRATGSNGPWTLVNGNLSDTASSWTNGLLTSSVRYYYYMSSVVDGKESLASFAVSAVAK